MFSNANAPTIDSLTSNALNLFPTTATPQQAQLKLQRLLYETQTNYRGPTQIQSTLAASLYDDASEYMSTLEMNRAASYTFGFRNSYGQNGTASNDLGGGTHGESVSSEMWELLVDLTLGMYTKHSILALTKTIHLVQHVLLHGSEACVTDGALLYRIETAVEPLKNLNTALVEQKMVEQILNNEGRATGIENDIIMTAEGIGQQLAQLGTKATAAMVKLRGGSVDKGHPVRVAAAKLHGIVSVPGTLQQVRMQQECQPQGSIVPIGSTKKVGYITDEGRLRLLQEKIAAEEEAQRQKASRERLRLSQAKSNLSGRISADSFGGGYTSSDAGGGKVVVGAANSLEDMIESAKYELEQHKANRQQKIDKMKTGFCDDPYARAREVAELETQNMESDPEFVKREKALKDALEYLEEMKKLEQEKAGDLLQGDLLGDSGGGAPVLGAASGIDTGDEDGGVTDLLGFDGGPAAPLMADVFEGGFTASAAMISSSFGRGGGDGDDLLGFEGQAGENANAPSGAAYAPRPAPTNSTTSARNPIMPRYMGGNNATRRASNPVNNMRNNNASTVGGGIMGTDNNGFDLRPSLLTGSIGINTNDKPTPTTGGPTPSQQLPHSMSQFAVAHSDISTMAAMGGARGTGALGGPKGTMQAELSEEVQEENSRKMQLAAGLFAGVVFDDSSKPTMGRKKPIMAMGNDSRISALDDLIPVAATPSYSAPTSNNSEFGSKVLSAMRSSDPFEMGTMGSNARNTAVTPAPAPSAVPPPPPSLSDPLDMGPLGGVIGNTSAIPTAAPPVAPPPPPMGSLSPVPSMARPSPLPANMAPSMAPAVTPNNPNNLMGKGNPSMEQIQEMIKQQQTQMAQMVQMMQQMQMQGSGGSNNSGANNGAP